MSEEIDNILIEFVKTTVNELKRDELFRRKAALTEIKSKIFPENVEFTKATYQAAFAESQIQVLKCFRDKSEMNRELAIQIMKKFIHFLDLNDYYLTYIFPVLVERIGSVEIIEESEEIRLELVIFLRAVINRYSKSDCLVPFLSDTVQILCQTVIDGYPKIKDASCNCIMDLATALPKHFHMQCENLINPVLKAFTHQHYKIRLIAIKTIGVIILHSTGANVIQNTVTPLAERLFDQNSFVRKEIGIVVAKLLLEYRDRYSHFHRLLPLILTVLSDDVPEVRQEIEVLWFQVGKQYEKENEKDLKDQIDYPVCPPAHYPTYLTRPNLGCRELVQRNASKISSALSAELSSWQEDIRIRCSQLLCVIVVHCESNITQSLQGLLPAMYSACEYQRDQQKAVHENVMRAAQYIGVFVPVKSWSTLVIPATSDAPTCGHIRVLRSMASGTPASDLHQISVEVADLIASESVCCSNRKAVFQNELVECCRVFISYPEVSCQLFKILITVVALSKSMSGKGSGDESVVADRARELLKQITEPEKHVKEILEKLDGRDATFGAAISTDRCIFDTLLMEWGISLIPHLPLVGNILSRALDEKCDAETRLRTFEALSRFLQSEVFEKLMAVEDQKQLVSGYVVLLIKDILIPALVWRAGRSAEALRTAASYCLKLALDYAPNYLIQSEEFFQRMLSILITLTDDASFRTRIYSTMSLAKLGKILEEDKPKLTKWANDTSIAFIKRLDDPNEAVRQQTMIALKEVLSFPKLLLECNMKFVVDGVLTHLDDQEMDKEVANLVIDVLKTVANTDTAYMKEKLSKQKHMFKNQDTCDELVTYLNNLTTE